jgi:hypothetical protein
MSNYPVWTVENLVKRWLEWRRRLGRATRHEERLSLVGEIKVIEDELERRFFPRGEDIPA